MVYGLYVQPVSNCMALTVCESYSYVMYLAPFQLAEGLTLAAIVLGAGTLTPKRLQNASVPSSKTVKVLGGLTAVSAFILFWVFWGYPDLFNAYPLDLPLRFQFWNEGYIFGETASAVFLVGAVGLLCFYLPGRNLKESVPKAIGVISLVCFGFFLSVLVFLYTQMDIEATAFLSGLTFKPPFHGSLMFGYDPLAPPPVPLASNMALLALFGAISVWSLARRNRL